jgi:hypothetical protein
VGTSNVGECFSRVEAINTDPLLTYCFISRVVTGVTNARCKDGPIFTLRVGKQARLPNALCVPPYDSVARQPALGPNAVSPEISSSRAATRFQHHIFCLRRISQWTSSRRAPRCRLSTTPHARGCGFRAGLAACLVLHYLRLFMSLARLRTLSEQRWVATARNHECCS